MKRQLTSIVLLTEDDGTTDIDVQSELDSEADLVVALLMVVEKLTGVSTDNYAKEVDEKHG